MPQNEITEGIQLPGIEDLEPLSDSETEFLRLIIQDGLRASEAYRRTHDPEGNLADTTVWAESSRLHGSHKVQSWRTALIAHGLHRGILQQSEFIAEMQGLAERAEHAGNYGAAVNAKANAGKVAGLYVERYEDITQRNLTVDQLIAMVRQLVGNDIALQISTRLGLEDKPAIEHLKTTVKQPDKVTAGNRH